MSEPSDDDIKSAPQLTELETLRLRADQMGVPYHHNTKVKKLKALIDDRLNGVTAPPNAVDAPAPVPNYTDELPAETRPETPGQRRVRLTKEAGRLVRVRVTNMNPARKEWEGEIYTVANSVVGTFRKYVPFNAEDGWHVPLIMLEMMREKECQVFYTVKNERGVKIRKGRIIKELAIELLDPLTGIELKQLGAKQAARNSVD